MAYIVGIAGGSASGKSTLSSALSGAISARSHESKIECISTDAFFRRGDPNSPTFISPTTGEEEFDCNSPDSVDNGELLKRIEELRSQSDLLIIEGLMILHTKRVREQLDLKIFIELDADVRALRRMLRDLDGGRMFSDPENIARYYLESAKPGHEKYVEPSKVHADLIVRGDGDFESKAALLADIVLIETGRPQAE